MNVNSIRAECNIVLKKLVSVVVNSSHTPGTTNPDKKSKNMTKKQKLEKKKIESEIKYGARSDTSVNHAISDTSGGSEGVTSSIEVSLAVPIYVYVCKCVFLCVYVFV